MKTEIIKIDAENINLDDLKVAAEIINNGGLVAFPTETVYGLGANAFDEIAVDGIFQAKGRPADNPLIVHISDYTMLDLVTNCCGEQRRLLELLGKMFWPGPLTIIVSRSNNIPKSVSCGLDTVGIRFPQHPIARALIKACGVPIAAPSANTSGKPSPTQAKHVIEDLNNKVDLIIDGGKCSVGLESTVLDITVNPAVILRPGAITKELLLPILHEVQEHSWMTECGNNEVVRSPGMKYKHYSPKAKITIFQGDMDKVVSRIKQEVFDSNSSELTIGILATDQTICYYNIDNILSLGNRNQPESLGANLFSCFREFDDLKVDMVFAEAVSLSGIGDAIMNRMYRAAGCRLIKV